MAQNGKPIDFLSSAEVFTETMDERYNDGKNILMIIASDGKRTFDTGFGGDEETIDALSTALYNDDDLLTIVQCSLALAITAKLKACDHDNN